MNFGDQIFSIEAYHEILPNEQGWVFGRMCCFFNDIQLGDINEPACMLNVTTGHFRDTLENIDALEDAELNGMNDASASNSLIRHCMLVILIYPLKK